MRNEYRESRETSGVMRAPEATIGYIRPDDGSGERRLKVSISWSADHRVVEGAELVAFIETWRSWVEHPHRLIAEGV